MKHVSTQVAVWRAGLGIFASASLLVGRLLVVIEFDCYPI